MLGLLSLFAFAALLLIIIGTAAMLYTLTHPPRKTLGNALARGMPTDPSQIELPYEERLFTLADGSTSPGWLIQGRTCDGPAVIIAHGFGSSRFNALCPAALVADFASQIIVYDMRAHGESTARSTRVALDDVDDLLAILEQFGEPRVVLCGHSLGAGVSIVAAARAAKQGLNQVVAVIADAPYRHWAEPIVGLMNEKRWPAYPFVWLTQFALLIGGTSLRGLDRAKHAAKLACPLLVLHGTDDPICRFESGQKIAAAAPRGRLVSFVGGKHSNLASIDRQRYVDALQSFFNQITQPSDVTASAACA